MASLPAADGVGADGKPTHSEFQAKYDGKDYPFKGNPDADALSYNKSIRIPWRPPPP